MKGTTSVPGVDRKGRSNKIDVPALGEKGGRPARGRAVTEGLFAVRGSVPAWLYWGVTGATAGLALMWWLIVTSAGWVDTIFLPPPAQVITTAWHLLIGGDLLPDLWVSFVRVTAGFLLAAALGLPLGLLAGTFKSAEAAVVPWSEFIRYMPVPAFLPLVMLWFGIGEVPKMVIIFLGSFFQLILMVADATRGVHRDLIHAAYTLGATRKHVVWQVLIPGALPGIVDALRIIVGWAWTYLVVAELVAANTGLGFRILKAQRFFQTDVIFTGIVVIGLLGLLTDWLFKAASRRLFPWAR